jgi:thiamine biosynthesis protein ThiS
MLRVNYKEMAWEEGLTVERLLQKMKEEKAYQFILRGRVTVIVNNEVIAPSDYLTKWLCDGDEVRVYPVIAGG